MPDLNVIYIGGFSRSGSTALAHQLGMLPNVANLGEVTHTLFSSLLLRLGLPCGCGQSLDESRFWSSSVKTISAEAREFARREIRIRSLARPRRFLRAVERSGWMKEARDVLSDAARRAGNCQTVVDASKHAATAIALTEVDGIRVHMLHLVRHPGAVIASQSRQKEWLPASSPLRTAWAWDLENLTVERHQRRFASYVRVRFEELGNNPVATLAPFLRNAGVDPAGPAQGEIQHHVAGNPSKLEYPYIWRAPVRSAARADKRSPAQSLPEHLICGLLASHYGY